METAEEYEARKRAILGDLAIDGIRQNGEPVAISLPQKPRSVLEIGKPQKPKVIRLRRS